MSIEEIDAVQFQVTRTPGAGYEASSVDACLDRVRAAMLKGDRVAPIVAAARFPLASRAGYAAVEVDDFLDRVVASDQERFPEEPAAPAQADREQAGFLGRLLKRR